MEQGHWQWVQRILRNIKLNKFKLKTQRGRKIKSCEDQIPEDWQNTLVRKYPQYPGLRRSNSSSSSFTSSGSTGSGTSSYSVNDFLRDLSAGEELDYHLEPERKSKTSTPFTCHILPLNRLERMASPSLPLHHLSGLKIYDDQVEEDSQKAPLKLSGVPSEDLYENEQFHQRFEEECRRMNQEDEEDGYEIIVIKNTDKKRSNCRTLKHRLRH